MNLLHLSVPVLLISLLVGVGVMLSQYDAESHAYSDDSFASRKVWLHLIPFTAPGTIIRGDDIAIDSKGTIYSGTAEGTIVFVDPKTDNIDLFLDLKNKFAKSSPIGIDLCSWKGRQYLIVADAVNGILRIDIQSKGVEVLVTKEAINLPNDLVVSRRNPDLIYFTDSTQIEFHDNFDQMQLLWLDYLLAKPSGRYIKGHIDLY